MEGGVSSNMEFIKELVVHHCSVFKAGRSAILKLPTTL